MAPQKKSALKKKSLKKNNNKFMNEMFNDSKISTRTPSNKLYNFNTIKSVSNSFFIFTIISILFVSFILYYLNELKKCDCFQNDEGKKINLNYLIIIESIILFFQIIMFFTVLHLIIKLKNFSGGNKENSIFMYIFLVLYFLIYGYFIYYIYLIFENIKYDCECSRSPIRYLLYTQAILYAISLCMTLVGLF